MLELLEKQHALVSLAAGVKRHGGWGKLQEVHACLSAIASMFSHLIQALVSRLHMRRCTDSLHCLFLQAMGTGSCSTGSSCQILGHLCAAPSGAPVALTH